MNEDNNDKGKRSDDAAMADSDPSSLNQGKATGATTNNTIALVSLVLLITIVVVAAGLFAFGRRKNRNKRDSQDINKTNKISDTSPLSKLDTTADLSLWNECDQFFKEYDELPLDSSLPRSYSSRKHHGQSSGALRSSSVVGASRMQSKNYGPNSSPSPTQPTFPISTRSYSGNPYDMDDERSDVELNDFFSVARHPAKVDGRLGRSLPRSKRNKRKRPVGAVQWCENAEEGMIDCLTDTTGDILDKNGCH